MEVIAFVGPSGTGKSHRAIQVAFDNKCDGIIDDGILIKGSKILAGSTAKNEQNKIQAVKRAIFSTDEHAAEVKAALAKGTIARLLIIGTSDHMIENICSRLELSKPSKTVYITDVATKLEIKQAKSTRMQQGRHEVPVPSVELKPRFNGYFADLPRNIFSLDKTLDGHEQNSIVRPNFSFYGKLMISDSAIKDIVTIIISEYDCLQKITEIKVGRRSDGSKGIIISVEVVIYYGTKIVDATRDFRVKIQNYVEMMTGLQVKTVTVAVRSLAIRGKD